MITLKGNDTQGGRGCGSLVDEGYYLTASGVGMIGAGGPLWVQTPTFGSGLDDLNGGNLFACQLVPNLGMVEIDPAASMLDGNATAAGDSIFEGYDVYEDLQARVGRVALADHVGKKHYTPTAFIKELERIGPNRKVSPDFARYLAESGLLPIPIIFFHDDIPIFDTVDQRDDVYVWASILINHRVDDNDGYLSSWSHKDWGYYSTYFGGRSHYMRVVLEGLDKFNSSDESHIRHIYGDQQFEDMKETFGNLEFERQAFAASWLVDSVKVTTSGKSNLNEKDINSGILQAKPGVAVDLQGRPVCPTCEELLKKDGAGHTCPNACNDGKKYY